MCISCGCKQANEDHGDKRHITMQTLEDAAQAANISVDEVLQNIEDVRGSAPASRAGSSKARSA